MKKIIFVFTFLIIATTTNIFAQATDTVMGWRHSVVAGINLTQASYSNWAQGGENSLAYVALITGKSIQNQPDLNWTTQYNFAYGQTKLGEGNLRKTDDKIDLSTVLTYKMGVYVNPYVSVTFLTQFTTGYNETDTSKTAISDFLDPAYSTQTVGLGYSPTRELKTRLGIGVRETFTNLHNQYSDDPTTPEIESRRIEGGFESITDFALQLDSNIMYTTKLQLFAPLKTLDKIIVHFDHTISAKISKYLSTNLTLNIINDRIVSPRTQIREGLSLGISYSIF